MSRGRRAGAAALVMAACLPAAALAGGAAATGKPAGCVAVLTEHRSGVELARLALAAADPQLQIAFEHSVLGTTVVDRYRFAPDARLVEERFEGEGYGLPHAAGPGERLERDGDGWRLLLDRPVHPLVVRPLPRQRMRVLLPTGELTLAALSLHAIEIRASGCAAAGAPASS